MRELQDRRHRRGLRSENCEARGIDLTRFFSHVRVARAFASAAGVERLTARSRGEKDATMSKLYVAADCLPGCVGMLLWAMACAGVPAKAAAPVTPRTEPAANASDDAAHTAAIAPKRRTMTVLVSVESPSAYCNGERMDSDGYRKTLTREKAIDLPPESASDTEIVRSVLDAATEGMCHTVMRQLNYRNDAGTLHIPPFDGWAGVSITMCSCKPEVEVNCARIPGVTRVVWDKH
jgi:hypothetical protein